MLLLESITHTSAFYLVIVLSSLVFKMHNEAAAASCGYFSNACNETKHR